MIRLKGSHFMLLSGEQHNKVITYFNGYVVYIVLTRITEVAALQKHSREEEDPST